MLVMSIVSRLTNDNPYTKLHLAPASVVHGNTSKGICIEHEENVVTTVHVQEKVLECISKICRDSFQVS